MAVEMFIAGRGAKVILIRSFVQEQCSPGGAFLFLTGCDVAHRRPVHRRVNSRALCDWLREETQDAQAQTGSVRLDDRRPGDIRKMAQDRVHMLRLDLSSIAGGIGELCRP